MAILLPFLALAFGVTLDFCRVYYATQTIQASAHAAVLYASGNLYTATGTLPQDAATQAAQTEAVSLQPPLDASNVAVSFTSNTATVTVSYAVPLLTPLAGGSSSVAVSRSVTMALAPTGP